MLNYKPESYLTDDEHALARSLFGGTNGARALKLLRKIMIPTTTDPELPIEEFGKDAFMGQIDFKSLPADEAKAVGMGFQLAHKAVMGGLIHLKTIANIQEPTKEEVEEARAKNSSK